MAILRAGVAPGTPSRPQTFPALFGPFDRTEMLAALHRHGPIRAPVLKAAFGGESGRSVNRERSNRARILSSCQLYDWPTAPSVVGINPKFDLAPELGSLLDALLDHFPLRDIRNEIAEIDVAKFFAAEHRPVDIEGLFGTHVRTRTLVALYTLGGSYSIGKLQRSVLEHFITRVRVAVRGLVDNNVLVRDGLLVAFNNDLPWMPQLLALLEALAAGMPEVVQHARNQDETRKTHRGTSHAHGTRFRLFGSRVNGAILTYLAAFGPSRIMAISAAISSVNPGAIQPLVDAGVVCRVAARKGRQGDIFSLNADYPIYRDLKALLRTKACLDVALPLRRSSDMYEGDDYSEQCGPYLPYTLFGISHKKIVATILCTLFHTPHAEAEISSLARLVAEHDAGSIRRALERLRLSGIVTSRVWKALVLYRLDERWPAHTELVNLLKAMGRVWPEFVESGSIEPQLFSPLRLARERDR